MTSGHAEQRRLKPAVWDCEGRASRSHTVNWASLEPTLQAGPVRHPCCKADAENYSWGSNTTSSGLLNTAHHSFSITALAKTMWITPGETGVQRGSRAAVMSAHRGHYHRPSPCSGAEGDHPQTQAQKGANPGWLDWTLAPLVVDDEVWGHREHSQAQAAALNSLQHCTTQLSAAHSTLFYSQSQCCSTLNSSTASHRLQHCTTQLSAAHSTLFYSQSQCCSTLNSLLQPVTGCTTQLSSTARHRCSTAPLNSLLTRLHSRKGEEDDQKKTDRSGSLGDCRESEGARAAVGLERLQGQRPVLFMSRQSSQTDEGHAPTTATTASSIT
ncbi:hypothetical protein ACOMHN_046135 [Nucella lapillus]